MSKILEPAKDYHSKPIKGSSFYKKIHIKSLLHAMTEELDDEKEAFILGSALHCAILEPERFNSEFMCEPSKEDFPGALVTADDVKAALVSVLGDKAPKSGTKAKLISALLEVKPDAVIWDNIMRDFELLSEGKSILTPKMMKSVLGMKESILSHPMAMEMLTGGEAEYSYYATDPETGIEMKCRPDYHNGGALIDIKTTRDASYESFAREIGTRAYHVQAAHYVDTYNLSQGAKYKDFFFIAVEKEFPFAVAVYRLDESQVDEGRKGLKKAMHKYAEFLKEGNLDDLKSLRSNGYSPSIIDIQVPYYLLDKIEIA